MGVVIEVPAHGEYGQQERFRKRAHQENIRGSVAYPSRAGKGRFSRALNLLVNRSYPVITSTVTDAARG